MKTSSFSLVLALFLSIGPFAQSKGPFTGNKKSSFTKYEGYINFSYHEKQDKVMLEVDKLETEFLYVNYLATGIGSNDIGLDRGQKGNQHIVKFVKAGNKLLLVQPNYDFRAQSDNPYEVKAVEEAFAQSVLWGFKIEKEENGTYYINASEFFMQDMFQVIEKLQKTQQGSYAPDKSRSAFYMPGTKNFPLNSEFEVTLTFTGNPEGKYIRSVTPTPEAVTVRQHHSFIQLPDDEYTPRVFDPRTGYIHITYKDYATPLSEPLEKRFIMRHRLQKKNPGAKVSEVVEPIVYYLDRGTPEPVRSALLEGARWWDEAFGAIGYKNAFRVELLPEGADLLDIRYNVIQWVHRATRGWSYGHVIHDPRTGEIIKGHVSLGSLRVRQDYLIAEGLLAPYENGDEIPKEVEEMALARIKQLSAHEVGHTLGLNHNYISSAEGRSSVMDYPHPLVEIKDGKVILTHAYDDKIGAWDKVFIAYGYQDFPDGTDEKKALNEIIQNSLHEGLNFLSDQDARPQGSAQPQTHLWDNGENAADELHRVMKIRDLALQHFGEKNIPSGRPYATLEEVLVPMYFFHRYQAEAAVKSIGGLDYRYAHRGDGQLITEKVPAEAQWKALDALLETISPEALTLPERILEMIPPRPLGYSRSRELINSRTGLTFDALSAAETASDMVISLILHPSRTARLVEYHARDKNQPSLEQVLDKLINATWKAPHPDGYLGEIQRTTDNVLLHNMMQLAANDTASVRVKAIVFHELDTLKQWLQIQWKKENEESQKAHYQYAESRILQFLQDPGKYSIPSSPPPPDGSPIGTDIYCGY